MYKKLSRMILLTFLFTLSQTLFADDSICRQGLKKMVDSLKLKEEQKTKINPILTQLKSTMKNNGSQMDALESQLRQQSSSTMDQKNIGDLIDKKAALIGETMKARYQAESEIFAILTPEQKTELQNKIKAEDEKIAAQFKKCYEKNE